MTRFILTIIFAVCTLLLAALPKHLSFDRITVEDGLSQSWVRAIEQDMNGLMWFGTSDGLNKFDGYSFTVYKHDPNDPGSLQNNHVQSLEFDNYGRLWVGSVSGLCYFDEDISKFTDKSSEIYTSVSSLIYSNNRMYVATIDGLFIYDLKKDQFLRELGKNISSQFANRNIMALAKDKMGKIWIASEKGLYIYDPSADQSNEKTAALHGFLPTSNVSALEIDSQDRVWVGTQDQGLYMLPASLLGIDKDNWINYRHVEGQANSIAKGRIVTLHSDKRNNLLIGIENGGLNVLNLNKGANFLHYQHDSNNKRSLSNNSVYSIFEDLRGDIWIGTYGDGINFANHDGDSFSNLVHVPGNENSLKNSFVNAIQQFGDELWVGTDEGMSIVNLKTKQYRHIINDKNNDKSLSANVVMAIFKDRTDDLWVGTWVGGLNYRPKGAEEFEHFRHQVNSPLSLPSNNVFAIEQDKEGTLWVALANGGLCYKRPSDNEFYKVEIPLENDKVIRPNWIWDIYISSKDLLWFSTDVSVGYYNLKTKEIKNYYPFQQQFASSRGIGSFVIFEDSRGMIWFGTAAGLIYLDDATEKFHFYTEQDGLASNSVKSILEDDRGNLWLGTNKGLSILRNAIRKPKQPEFINYNVFDGLQGNEFNRSAAFKDADGTMYFGGSKGISCFHPDSIIPNLSEPRVVITNFEVLNNPPKPEGKDLPFSKNFSGLRSIRLDHNHSVFTIEFAAISFVAREKNQYAYKLEGIDEDWNYLGNERSVTFANLDPGNYIFKVKAANNSGVWSTQPMSLQIKVLPPWWLKNAALAFYLIIVLLSVFLLIRITMARFREQENLQMERSQREQMELLNQRKLQFFTNISHEFRTPLTLIYSPLEDILRNQQNRLPVDLRVKFSIIYKNALRLNRLIGELMDFRKIQFNKLSLVVYNQDLNAFVRNTCNLFSEEANDNGVSLKIETTKEPIKTWFDPSMIEKVLFNLISNAMKVTPEEGSITVEVYETYNQPSPREKDAIKWMCVSVKDTGPGLKPEELDKIFDRFYQTNSLTNTYYSGTGIGLSLARNIIELHNGYIRVNSVFGRGAEFVIWLRDGKAHYKTEQLKSSSFELSEQLSMPVIKENTAASVTNAELKKNSILIVEDNVELRNYLKTELGSSYKVWVAKNGQQGIEMALKHFPDLIVSDILMPEKDGYELCAEVKTNPKISHIPVVLLTARGAVEDQLKGAETGADDYIVKPFNTRLLKSKIKQLITMREELVNKYSSEINLLSEEHTTTSVEKNFLKEVNQHILNNIGDSELSVESIGLEMAMSRSQLYRRIKALSGLSMNEYLRTVRLETARKYIVSKKYPINEVVYKVGFASPSYFSKCYKEHFGNLPSEE